MFNKVPIWLWIVILATVIGLGIGLYKKETSTPTTTTTTTTTTPITATTTPITITTTPSCKTVIGKYCVNNVLTDCPIGTMCLRDNMTEPDDCISGYYCEKPDMSPKICPIGNYCPLHCQDIMN